MFEKYYLTISKHNRATKTQNLSCYVRRTFSNVMSCLPKMQHFWISASFRYQVIRK